MKRALFLLCALAGLAFFTAAPAMAQDAAVRQRMEARLPAIDALKAQGVVGENNLGLLEPRGELPPAGRETVQAENQDRQAVYDAIARQTGATRDQVGRLRARRIAELSASGIWIQADDGSWRRKP
jgi:uncharacterized protein